MRWSCPFLQTVRITEVVIEDHKLAPRLAHTLREL